MTRVEVYFYLMKRFRKQKFSYDIDNSISFKGNLAFFIENSIDRDDWPKIYDEINKYLDNNDLNSVCYYISQFNYEYAIREAERKGYPSLVIELQKTRISDLYNENDLDDFQYISYQSYPDWFAEINYAFDI